VRWTSVLAIYLLVWVLSAFLIMPWGIRTHDELGQDTIPGQASSAPANFRPGRIALKTTALSVVLMALFYLNFTHRWVTPQSLGWLFPVPASLGSSTG
jgi:predicted secreted protein